MHDKLMVNVIHTSPLLRPGDWWYLDNGLPVPPPEPTPEERAFAVLEPHLVDVPLFRAGLPAPRDSNRMAE